MYRVRGIAYSPNHKFADLEIKCHLDCNSLRPTCPTRAQSRASRRRSASRSTSPSPPRLSPASVRGNGCVSPQELLPRNVRGKRERSVCAIVAVAPKSNLVSDSSLVILWGRCRPPARGHPPALMRRHLCECSPRSRRMLLVLPESRGAESRLSMQSASILTCL